MDLGIAGRTAIVCASSRGLGRACATALAEAGCHVIVNGRDAAVVQDGGKTSTITLSPAAPNMFVGKLAAPLGAKARVVFSSAFDGHSLQARFVAP